jgi:26S proteasome non-ATPase regulatory subunit 9
MQLSLEGEKALDFKKKIKILDDNRSTITTSLNSILPTSLHGESLVDQDGFPRADIDLFAVRIARNQVSCLLNDLKDINRQLDTALHSLHALGQEAVLEAIQAEKNERSLQTTTTLMASKSTFIPKTETEIILKPWAIIDSVSTNSPASESGLRCGDKILKMGNAISFATVTSEVRRYAEDIGLGAMKVHLSRNGEEMMINLLPKPWNGQGVLGCHIIPCT